MGARLMMESCSCVNINSLVPSLNIIGSLTMCRNILQNYPRHAFGIIGLLILTGLVYMNSSILEPVKISLEYTALKLEPLTKFIRQPGPKVRVTRETVQRLLPGLNELGGSDLDVYDTLIHLSTLAVRTSSEHDFLEELREMLAQADRGLKDTLSKGVSRKLQVKKLNSSRVYVAVVACGNAGRMDAQVLIKSAVLFSMDTHLHLVIFTDHETISTLLTYVMKLKWTVNLKFAIDFTFEFHLESFPNDDPVWRKMWRPCSTQRLFFPSLLPNVDSVIYMDADTIFLSNVSNTWEIFANDMKDGQVAAMTSNTEYPAKGHYGTSSKIPYYGRRGLMAGVMLMNLTRMRSFDMENKAIKAYKTYKQKIHLADQDIYNIVFHFNPEKVFNMDCSHNLYNYHCGWKPNRYCYHQKSPSPDCFCFPALEKGVQILHGQRKTFHGGDWPFITETWKRFNQLDLAKDSPLKMIQDLKSYFASHPKTCFNLTADALYSNAHRYLEQMLA